jgi:hypothetical protein
MVEQRSRLQLLGDLRRLDREHAEAVRLHAEDESPTDLWERYTYGELAVIADFLEAYTRRLQGSPSRR